MKLKTGLMAASALAVMIGLGGCSTLENLITGATSGSPAQANSAAAAESLYTAADKALTAAVQQGAISDAEATKLGGIDNQVYAALVTVRKAAEANDSAALAAALAAFNAIDAPFEAELTADGVATTTGAGT